MLSSPVADLFTRQYGLAGEHQLRRIGLDRGERRRLRSHREIDQLTPRVRRHRIAPLVPEQTLLAAVLDGGSGAVLWGKSAARLWGFGRFRPRPIHVGRPRSRVHGPRLGQMHLLTTLDDDDVTVHREIPVARPELALLWLAGSWTHRFDPEVAERRLGVTIDQAWRQRLVDGRYIHELAARSGGRGRSGIVAMRAALETRPPDHTPAGSRLEERFEEICPASVRRLMDRQVTVDAEITIRTVDFRVRPWPLIVEINGEAFHSSLSDRAADAERYQRLHDLGFSVVVWWEHDIWHDAATVETTMLRLVREPDPSPTLHRPTPAPWLI